MLDGADSVVLVLVLTLLEVGSGELWWVTVVGCVKSVALLLLLTTSLPTFVQVMVTLSIFELSLAATT